MDPPAGSMVQEEAGGLAFVSITFSEPMDTSVRSIRGLVAFEDGSMGTIGGPMQWTARTEGREGQLTVGLAPNFVGFSLIVSRFRDVAGNALVIDEEISFTIQRD